MRCLFLLEDYGKQYHYIPNFEVKLGVTIDVVLGSLFSIIIAVFSILGLLLSVFLTLSYYLRILNHSTKFEIVKNKSINPILLDKKFLVLKIVEIFLLLIPIFGFLGLFIYKVLNKNCNSIWKKGFYFNVSICQLPCQMFNTKIDLKYWSICA